MSYIQIMVLSIQVWNLKNFLKSGVFYTRQAVLDFLKVMVLSKEQFKQPKECLTSASVMELIPI